MSAESRTVLEASAAAAARGDDAALAVVLQTEGSTYVQRGAIALFGGRDGQVGWLSGGCLEAELATRAAQAIAQARVEWIEIDTRDDAALLAGSALGCRGRLRIALLPLRVLPGWAALIEVWYTQRVRLTLTLSDTGQLRAVAGTVSLAWSLPASTSAWAPAPQDWTLCFEPLPRVAVFGAGPETPVLLPLLRMLGWMTVLVERRPRWQPLLALADIALAESPPAALQRVEVSGAAAALVMHHHFELDRETLEALAASAIPFVGLLGPHRRREDLFKVLPAHVSLALQPRLHSPVGLNLGGQGAEAIALSIAAQLQAHLHSE